MIYPAHIRRDENGGVQEVQTVEVHCRNCARLAAQEAAKQQSDEEKSE